MERSDKWQPTKRDAAWWLAIAAAFIAFTWWEHGWRIRRGDYPAPYLKHTWYWYARPLLALAALAVISFFWRSKARRDRQER